ncbi:UNVERIFIED_CONTAM: hypothetical protein GTU68_013816 [Idotea baltica]|nr:hypothetical protein [Idotea baltica]
MAKIKRDDEVVVIAGKDKGKRGKVQRILEDGRVIVSGVQMIKKHQKPNPQLEIPGGIIEKEAPIAVSNIAIVNPETNKADRVGYKVLDDGKKVRVYKSNDEIAPKLKEELALDNVMEVPKITKITLNMGVGEALGDKKVLEHAVKDMEAISGQKVVVTKARKSVAGFKVREDWPIGCKVTLRSDRMYEFLERFVGIAIPRIRDFRGISPKQFDGRGNFSMGVTEQIIFPEIDYDKVDALRGLDICITTTAKTDDEGRALLRAFNFPLRG